MPIRSHTNKIIDLKLCKQQQGAEQHFEFLQKTVLIETCQAPDTSLFELTEEIRATTPMLM